MLSFTSLHWEKQMLLYFGINCLLHAKISIILVFLELVIQDSDYDGYFIVNDEIKLKAKTF